VISFVLTALEFFSSHQSNFTTGRDDRHSQPQVLFSVRILFRGSLEHYFWLWTAPLWRDVLCWVIPSQADIFAVVEVFILNFSGLPGSLPSVRVIPSTHIVLVQLASGEVVPCVLKVLHREVIEMGVGVTYEVCMTFDPLLFNEQ
jgi:hypothetical protein